MKKIIIILLIFPLVSFSQNEKFSMLFGIEATNFDKIHLNDVLDNNSFHQVRNTGVSISLTGEYLPKNFGLFVGIDFYTSSNKAIFLHQGIKVGGIYKFNITNNFVVQLNPYLKYGNYVIRSYQKTETITSADNLGGPGILEFNSQSLTYGGSFGFPFGKFRVDIGAESYLTPAYWNMTNGTVHGLRNEKFVNFYASFIYKFTIKPKKQ